MYAQESFTDSELAVLSRFFTNADRPVFALINLPEIVKGALFARYSRTHKSLRRIFLDEFYKQPEIGLQALAEQISRSEDESLSTAAIQRAERLYDRVFIQYGDDSVAQLGGAHLACEQASALLAKVIERGRIAAYLEQSTRYIYYDRKIAGSAGAERYRYTIPPEIAQGPLADVYRSAMDDLFDTYSHIVSKLKPYFEKRFPKTSKDSEGAYARAIRARACDTARGLLPAATISNIGVFATGQAYEAMLIRMNAHPLQEARDYAQMMLTELRKVIPGFLKRVDSDHGKAWSKYFSDVRNNMNDIASEIDTPLTQTAKEFDYGNDEVKLVDWDRDAEIKLVVAALYPYMNLSERELHTKAMVMNKENRAKIIRTYMGDRSYNRRHKPGRGMEIINYRFEVLSDFGSFRDLQRHRMMTIEWQPLTPYHGYDTPPEIEDIGGDVKVQWSHAMDNMAELYEKLKTQHNTDIAQYAVPFGYRIRYAIQMNVRQAFHMLELRTAEQGHSDYRRICLKMHELIRKTKGHQLIADAMEYIDNKDYGLGRIKAERRQIDSEQTSFDLGF